MRIISGKFKGRRLKTMKDQTTRPTSDKVKEAFFQMTGPYYEGGSFLDCYAGSGAMALEALSRGMTHAVAIEKNNKAYQIVSENTAMLQATDLMTSYNDDFHHRVRELKERFKLVYCDPPYRLTNIEEDLVLLKRSDVLVDRAIVCYETSREFAIPIEIPGFSFIKEKQYPNTTLTFYRFEE
ncbi:16S rRNA (guanine(966)-N(2))-methyltransferase RsmD [Bavariicoccus seileri]|uniref:16S rRNA (guanine(966)-N(2))-methyltransferase RsmD n=1 Tax=Bavariicoccus seileri TaxID=549685 RepID=UPI003F913437